MKFSPKMLHLGRVRVGIASVAALGLFVAIPLSAQAATAPVPLGTADSFVVLAGSTVTNTGATTLNGDVGVSPKAALTGFSSLKLNGTKHAADSVAAGAQKDLTTAYVIAAGAKPVNKVPVELSGKTLQPGVYSGGALGLTGTLTLDGGNNPNAVFIFQAASTLITGSNSHVKLINVNPCNVFWQVTSSATLGSGSKFVGTIMALTDVHLKTGAVVDGRALARNGEVTLEANTITKSTCKVTTTSAATATPTAQVSAVPTGAVRTGDGSTSGNGASGNNALALLSGALLLAGVGGASVVAARRRRVTI
jgi:hypothetical protein